MIPPPVEEMLKSLPSDSCVIEVEEGPDEQGRSTFFAYWHDAALGRGIRGQVFRASVEDFQKRWVEHHPNAIITTLFGADAATQRGVKDGAQG